MKCLKADNILPKDLLAAVQKYVQGGLLYIPKPKESRKKWGENSGYRSYVEERNNTMRMKFLTSNITNSIDNLADEYNLAVETVKKIVYSK
ncbi:MAG: CD3324 family protein [Oscillospiraceae bacterium]|nr:CD3324 family protein [Oscillospiraceae bacterium]